MRILLLICLLVAMFSLLPVQPAAAAELDMHLRFYKVDGVTIGELSFGEQVAFRLNVASDAVPVMSVQRGSTGGSVSPDIVNGMFMLRFNKEN